VGYFLADQLNDAEKMPSYAYDEAAGVTAFIGRSLSSTVACGRSMRLVEGPGIPYDPAGALLLVSNWPNRDPITEQGGVNLYAMVWNDTVNLSDYLGLVTWSEAIDHWLEGTGGDFSVTFTEIDPGLSPSDFTPSSGKSFDDLTKSACSEKKSRSVNIIKSGHDIGGPIGRHNFRLNGNITYNKDDCTWDFSGTVESQSGRDRFDFDSSWADDNKPDRSFPKEFATSIGFLVETLGYAKSFDFVITGNVPVSDSGKCN
jgi:hypothetical protein